MPQPNTRVGRYIVVRELARGGMATVYVAHQPDLGREIALKELSSFHALNPAMAERFSREAQVAAALAHPSIVTVFEFFEHDGVPYIAMEYLARGSLRPLVAALTLPQIAGVLEGTLAALAHAEAHGVVHRDIKPENMLLTPDGRVKIADFGIAKAYNRVWTAQFPTATGMAIGTPTYMAPEQAMGQGIGPWTDLYATGVVAYELLIGRPPFINAEEPLAVLMRHVTEPVPPLRGVRPDVDERLAAWVERMLAKAPDQRPRGPAEAWSLLEDIVVDLAGPMWRREARLPESGEAAQRPLTPAPFDEPGPAVYSPPPAPAAPAPVASAAAPPATVAPAPAPAAARRPRRRLIGAGLLAAAGAAVALALLLGGGSEEAQLARGSTVELPECYDRLLERHTRADVVVGVDRELGPAPELEGRPLALALTAPKLLGIMTVTYRRRPPDHFFELGEVRDAACRRLSPVLQGAGTLPILESYDRVRVRFAGKPYQASLAEEEGRVSATLEPVPEPELTVRVTVEARRVTVEGTIEPDAAQPLTVEVFDAPRGGQVIERREIQPSSGRFRTSFRYSEGELDELIPAGARVRVVYSGDDTYANQEREVPLRR